MFSKMANKTKTNDLVSTTSSTKSRASSRQQNNSLNEVNECRVQEKREMQSLNDRLATQLSKIREIENENRNLQEQLLVERENCEIKIEELKIYYEDQLNQLRGDLDNECQNSARKFIEFEKYKQSVKELERERNDLIGDLKQIEKRNSLLTNENKKLKDKLINLEEDLEPLRKLIQKLETEKITIEKAARKNLAQAETENLRAISLKGKLKAMEEKFNSEKYFHKRELEEMRLKFEQEKEEQIEEALNLEIEQIRTEIMMKTRREFEQKNAKSKQDLEKQHSDILINLKEQLKESKTGENIAKAKSNSLQALIDNLNAKIHDLNQNETKLNTFIAQLQSRVEFEQHEKAELLVEKDRQIKDLEDELNSKNNENQQVLESNIQLNDEIRIYRSLLDEHEKSQQSNELDTSSQRTRASSPNRRIAHAVRKRKRTIDHVNETTIVNKSVGPIAIDDSTDQFIRLMNRSKEPVALGGWELKRENDNEGFAFKFHKSVIVQPGETVTVYSVDAENAVHNPPVEIKMKKNWPAAGKTTLFNPNKEEIAKWEWSSNLKRSRYDEDEGNRSCTLM